MGAGRVLGGREGVREGESWAVFVTCVRRSCVAAPTAPLPRLAQSGCPVGGGSCVGLDAMGVPCSQWRDAFP